MCAAKRRTVTPKRWDWLTRMIRRNGFTVGAEVGVANGKNMRHLLEYNPRLRMYAVDKWEKVEGGGEAGDPTSCSPGCTSWDPVEGWNRFKLVTRQYKNRLTVLRGDSIEMAQHVEDESLDFVFIDADHRYEGVYRDIVAWAPKVKPRGVICGHDMGYPRFPGVNKAVSELIPNYRDAGIDYVWWARKEDYEAQG